MTTRLESTREETAQREVAHTEFRRGVSVFLAMAALATIFSVTVVQQTHDLAAHRAGRRAAPVPQAYDIFSAPARALRAFADTRAGLLERILALTDSLHADIDAYETGIDDGSAVVQAILPSVMDLLVGRLGAGNEKAYVGRDGWLFYRPDIDFLTGPGYLDPTRLRRRALSGDRWKAAPQPDPLKAIIEFRDQLARRGIRLILIPAPPKSAVHPERFARACDGRSAAMRNPSDAAFRAALERAGVPMYDVADALVAAKAATGRAQYLRSDTHWTPEAMLETVQGLARMIARTVKLPPAPHAAFKSEPVEVANLGDIARMLRLPADQRLYAPQSVTTRRILDGEGRPWRADPAADVLLLGDSFANIYSLPAMGWGDGAGFAEQLAFALGRPLDCILRNDDGAYATRQILSRELARGKDRLAAKRLVLWEFAARELASGDWKLLPMDLGAAAPRRFLVPPAGAERTVIGTIESIAPAPRPGSVPYKDHIVAVHLAELEGAAGQPPPPASDALVYLWSMRDNTRTNAARLRAGQRITVRLRPWADVAGELERINRTDPDDETLLLEDPCWGELLAE